MWIPTKSVLARNERLNSPKLVANLIKGWSQACQYIITWGITSTAILKFTSTLIHVNMRSFWMFRLCFEWGNSSGRYTCDAFKKSRTLVPVNMYKRLDWERFKNGLRVERPSLMNEAFLKENWELANTRSHKPHSSQNTTDFSFKWSLQNDILRMAISEPMNAVTCTYVDDRQQ